MINRILITGANGFVGSAVSFYLKQQNVEYRTVARSSNNGDVVIGNIDTHTQWTDALIGIEVIVHAAARVHVMNDATLDPLAEFRQVNVEGTLNLARQAVAAGVRRFIFISSIKVNGESTELGLPFFADDLAAPLDPYGVSKCEAEQGLLQLAKETGLEVVIIRPPLVYGPGVKANFAAMMKWLNKGIPLPLGAIHNQRSLVALDNLVDLIVTCIDHPAAANQIFLAGDGEDLSTTELLQKMAKALGVSSRLIPIPMWCLQFGARLLGKQAMAQRLCGSLQVDISKAKNVLGWTPPFTVDEALQKTADEFLKRNA
ncbi:SDR family oxidoreductase [Deefgea sp. CFH1-16]|uniref:UDP-glucose 4-epimerase family protein n=1 Tax=Deefgea sp. CFH1-16 TaxID=2675457 RepID=UPI0015F59045|nr:SDR family oxidoreductase [Deefgea sp. CFH1-16]MBM5573546.1 NAD-dependent epimerase/dehydratase family protein [Deefgea sp. CFH1-16]